ncbi:MAG: hypothetical protein MUO76_06705 [Anaerolineaceae bacterium]|jgi:flagellar basal body-associated protein FliL|nr:hypothetical protein [Anaerolineaceae bacterium]
MEKKENKKNSQKATWIVIGLCIVALIGTSVLAVLISSNLNLSGGEKDFGPPIEMQPGNDEGEPPQEIPAQPEVQILEPEPLIITE